MVHVTACASTVSSRKPQFGILNTYYNNISEKLEKLHKPTGE